MKDAPGQMEFVRCSKCTRYLPETYFHAQKAAKKGKLQAWCKPCRRVYALERRHKIRDEVLSAYGARCLCCGETMKEFLTIDHIHGGGRQHRLSLGSMTATTFYEWLRREGFPQNDFRCLCMNCNFARGIYGHCPHERTAAHVAD